jgi:hypothetical protein
MAQDHETPDSVSAEQAAAPVETPAQHVAEVQKKKNLYLRLTSSMPLVVTILVHVLLVGAAGAIVVQQTMVEKKKTFEASSLESSAPQVEHRLQVARRGGASGGASSPVSANRIYSTAAGALAMPEMPELPSMGAGGFGGFGGMGSGVGLGAGTGMATSLGGGTGLGGRGFMSLSFLGATSQNVSKVIFVVDVSEDIMDLRKGGFQAFTIIREEIMRLVGRLPPSAQFNVVLYRSTRSDDNSVDVNLYERELVAATADNKKDFFAWMTPVNAQLNNYGPFSATRRTGWRRRPIPPEAGIDPLFLPPVWSRAVHAALEMRPDVVYVITAGQGTARRRVDDQELARRRAAKEKEIADFEAEVRREGMDPAQVRAARDRAYSKAGGEMAAANRRLVAAGKDPIVVSDNHAIFRADVQAELRKNGIRIELDKTGWSKKDGSTFNVPWTGISSVEGASWEDFITYYARLQRHLVPERPALNIFLFVGPNDRPDSAVRNLTNIARRNGGNFQLLTTKRLEELRTRDQAADRR